MGGSDSTLLKEFSLVNFFTLMMMGLIVIDIASGCRMNLLTISPLLTLDIRDTSKYVQVSILSLQGHSGLVTETVVGLFYVPLILVWRTIIRLK